MKSNLKSGNSLKNVRASLGSVSTASSLPSARCPTASGTSQTGQLQKQSSSQLGLDDLLTPTQVEELKKFLKDNKPGIGRTIHNLTMNWLDRQPLVLDRFRQHGIIKPYGAYIIEFFLSSHEAIKMAGMVGAGRRRSNRAG